MKFQKLITLLKWSLPLIITMVSCEYTDELLKLTERISNENECTRYSSFGIYLSDGSLLISDKGIDAYVKAEHKILLNEQGIEMWHSSILDHIDSIKYSGTGYKVDFIVKLNDEEIYKGKFWNYASSMSFDGVVIMNAGMFIDKKNNLIEIEKGYPGSMPGADVRDDQRIYQFFECQGKLK